MATFSADRVAPRQIGDDALIGDCRAAPLGGNDGSIDWCCLPIR